MRKRVVIIVVCLLLVCAVVALCLYINSTPKHRVLKELSEGEVYYYELSPEEEGVLLDSSSVGELLEALKKPWRRPAVDYDIAYSEYLIVKGSEERIIGIDRGEDYLLLFLDEGKWEVDLS